MMMPDLKGVESVLSMSPDQLKNTKLPELGWAAEGPMGGCEQEHSASSHGAGEEGEVLPTELDPTDWEYSLGTEQTATETRSTMDAGLRQPVRSLNGPYHAVVGRDRLSARYVGKGNHAQDVGTVKANRPLPRHQVRQTACSLVCAHWKVAT
jgi:hypothetical protein